MSETDNGFFATQINQKGSSQPQQQKSTESPVLSPQKSVEVQEEETHSLRDLLTAFNAFDKQEKGLIYLQNAEQILATRNISTENMKQYHKMSLPLFEDQVTFDEFLFIFCLSQNTSDKVEDKYSLCKTVDERLIDFLKLLNKYRKKSERNGSYKEAKNSKNKIQEIRNRELERRNKYLKILYETEVVQTEKMQRERFADFCANWDQFMNQYEITAADLVKKVKDRQGMQAAEFEARTREELASKMHFSKYLLELQLKEKNLVKVQQYEKAREAQQQIEEMKLREIRQKQLADQQVIELRLKTLKKQQEATYSTLLQKIQKDRNDHMKKRQSQTERLMVRNKSQLTQIDHRYNETIKRIHQALHNLGLESDKAIKTSRQ